MHTQSTTFIFRSSNCKDVLVLFIQVCVNFQINITAQKKKNRNVELTYSQFYTKSLFDCCTYTRNWFNSEKHFFNISCFFPESINMKTIIRCLSTIWQQCSDLHYLGRDYDTRDHDIEILWQLERWTWWRKQAFYTLSYSSSSVERLAGCVGVQANFTRRLWVGDS